MNKFGIASLSRLVALAVIAGGTVVGLNESIRYDAERNEIISYDTLTN